MKHQSILSAALLTLVTSGAMAQSSVTVGGILDSAVRVVHNEGGGSVKSVVSGSNQTSRLYFRGEEDLGSGLAAGFWLESGVNVDTGTAVGGTQFFDRRATLSLVSRGVGELRMGRDYVPTYTIWSRHDPYTHVGVAGSNNFSSSSQLGPIRSAFGTGPNTTVRSSNAVEYLLPSGLGGVEGGLMVAAGEGGTAANGQDKLVGGRIGWQADSFGVHAAHVTTSNDLTTSGKFKDTLLAVNGAVANVRLTAALRRYEQAAAKESILLLSATVSLGQVEVKASYLKADMKGKVGSTSIDANDATQFGIGAIYNLSKRSALYVQGARISNDGRATFSIPGGTAMVAGGNSTGWEAGLRHNF
ncbi:porin [Pelomonas sp. CA6]|uniref:porin n=1 Tax=Pelomonas sp. CA6 TaxID=2907999 RepID=UPI001F4C0A62|nr:porin [Pelomonas sp. CA6]MCH7345483.1 porin [Pelomonas sp. CA6]